jgi:hypothetical protein
MLQTAKVNPPIQADSSSHSGPKTGNTVSPERFLWRENVSCFRAGSVKESTVAG